jgi:hypothetical protein
LSDCGSVDLGGDPILIWIGMFGTNPRAAIPGKPSSHPFEHAFARFEPDSLPDDPVRH